MIYPPNRLSAVVITLNSERVLPEVLESLTWCDELLLVDSGSTDQTLAIAEQFGCRIMHHDFNGFGAQKHFAVSQALHDWVLVIDADEIVPPALQAEIKKMLINPGQLVGVKIPVTLVFLGQLMRYGSEYKCFHTRLFNRQFGNYNLNRVHEDVALLGPLGQTNNYILHHSYGSLHEYFEKFNRYTTAGALDMNSAGRRGPIWQVVVRLPFTFLKSYFLKLNVLNGYPGFVWALLSAMYPVVKYAKLREIQQKTRFRRSGSDSSIGVGSAKDPEAKKVLKTSS